MSRTSSITCVFPTGECFYCSESEAEKIVSDQFGEWDGKRTVRMTHHDRTGGRLSAQVGEYLAESVRRNQPWAETMVAEIAER